MITFVMAAEEFNGFRQTENGKIGEELILLLREFTGEDGKMNRKSASTKTKKKFIGKGPDRHFTTVAGRSLRAWLTGSLKRRKSDPFKHIYNRHLH